MSGVATVEELRQQDIAVLEKEVEDATRRLNLAKQKAQAACVHPYSALSIMQGAVCEYNQGITRQSLWVKCSLCNAHLNTAVSISR